MAMERHERTDTVWAQNVIISRNDQKRKTHIDEGERPAATTDDEDGQSTIYQFHLAAEATLCTVVSV